MRIQSSFFIFLCTLAAILSSFANSSAALEQQANREVEHIIELTQAELLRIFRIPPDRYPLVSFKIVPKEKLLSPTQIPLSAVYLDGKIYISESLLSSRQVKFSIRHELTHWIIDSLSNGRCPAWIDEGIAQILGGPPSHLVAQTRKHRKKALRGTSLSLLEESFANLDEDSLLLAYTRSRIAARSMIFRWTIPKIRDYLLALGAGQKHHDAFREVFGESVELFEEKLHQNRETT